MKAGWRPVLCVRCLSRFLVAASVASLPAGEVLVPAGSVWKYLPVTNDVGTAWREIHFDDRAWSSGPAQLGYGDQDEETIVPFFPHPELLGGKNIATYFRHAFMVTNSAGYSNLTLSVLRDDGAVVHLNGTEVFRSNMPTGEVNYATPALTSVFAPDENFIFFPTNVSTAVLREGVNVLAVEIHQNLPTSADISFDLELASDGARTLPILRLIRNGGTLTLRWPLWAADFRPYSATHLTPPVSWLAVTNRIQSEGTQWRVDIPSDSASRFFRLEAP